jgi:hypothetical protein
MRGLLFVGRVLVGVGVAPRLRARAGDQVPIRSGASSRDDAEELGEVAGRVHGIDHIPFAAAKRRLP